MESYVRSQFRIPLDLADWLKECAKNNSRSMNGELVAKLREIKVRENRNAVH